MEWWPFVVTAITLIGTIIIAANNLFGLRDRFLATLRDRLNAAALEEDIEHRKVEGDRETLGKLRELLPADDPIMELLDYDFGGAYTDDLLKPMYRFLWECRKPEFEFHDSDLEPLRQKLEQAVHTFTRTSGEHTFHVGDSTRVRKIPNEWHVKQPERWHDARRKLNQAADAIVEAYDALVRTGRKKLGAS